MFYPAQLVLKNYVPLRLEIGMLFTTKYAPDTEKEVVEVWAFEESLSLDVATYIDIHGYPVKLSLVDEQGDEIAEHHEIGWFEKDPSQDLGQLTIFVPLQQARLKNQH